MAHRRLRLQTTRTKLQGDKVPKGDYSFPLAKERFLWELKYQWASAMRKADQESAWWLKKLREEVEHSTNHAELYHLAGEINYILECLDKKPDPENT